MTYQDFDWAGRKENSDRIADLLARAGIRLEQRIVNEPGRRTVYVLAVHAEDLARAEELRSTDQRERDEEFVRTLRFVRQPYAAQDMLIAREPTEDGYYVSEAYHGQRFDKSRFRVVRGGWDHEHCYLCWAKVMPGDEWWATEAPGHDGEIGLCAECHAQLFQG